MNHQTVKINVESKKDNYGRQRFTTYWVTLEGTKRAQCFHSNVSNQVSYWKKQPGIKTVLVSDLF